MFSLSKGAYVLGATTITTASSQASFHGRAVNKGSRACGLECGTRLTLLLIHCVPLGKYLTSEPRFFVICKIGIIILGTS